MKRNIILIGGAPTTGKSYIGARVAKHLGLPYMSTDQIRGVMKLVARTEDYPELFAPGVGYDAEHLLTNFSAQEIVDMELAEGPTVWSAVIKSIDKAYNWPEGFVMEGVHILPELVARDCKDNQEVRTVFLIDEDEDRMRDVIFKRGLWGKADTYADDLKEKEVEWASLFSRHIQSEAKVHGFPCVEVEKQEADLGVVLQALKAS